MSEQEHQPAGAEAGRAIAPEDLVDTLLGSGNPTAAEAWVRFLAAALSAAPHAPIDKLALTADDALGEYLKRLQPGGRLSFE